jgi:hypothetical protein
MKERKTGFLHFSAERRSDRPDSIAGKDRGHALFLDLVPIDRCEYGRNTAQNEDQIGTHDKLVKRGASRRS